MAQAKFSFQPIALEALDGGDNLLQSGFWAAHKQRFGWSPYAYSIEPSATGEGGGPLSLLVLSRPLAAGRRIAYVPYGPVRIAGSTGSSGVDDERLLCSLGQEAASELPDGTLFVRFDLEFPDTEGPAAPPKSDFAGRLPGLVPAAVDVQPPSTVIVDLSPEPERILASMKQKTRYNIRLAERRGVRVEEAGIRGIERWYELYRETARRDHIAIHSIDYYRTLFELARQFPGRRPDIRLYMASHESEDLAGVITAFYGRRATYLYGASSNEKRNLMPAYLLQWRAMQDARGAGCSEYDLFGIPPSEDPSHPMAGLYRFKTGFGGRALHRPGCWDLPLNRPLYALYRAAERARSFYYHRFRKLTRGGRS
ncbi:lipid II:glycine glycyltransferase FemX [Salinispira pacifica]